MSVDTLGEYLQKVRNERGMTIDQVAAITRISAAYIRALEENRLEALPGEVFVRGFVQVYGRCLGLADQELMPRFKRVAQEFYRTQEEARQSTQKEVRVEETRRTRQSRALQAIIIAALGLAIILVYNVNSRRAINEDGTLIPSKRSVGTPPEEKPGGGVLFELEETPPENPAASPLTPLKTPQAAPPSPGDKLRPPAINLPSARTESASFSEPLILRLDAIETSWVAVTIDDKIAKEVVLRPGESVVWKALDSFVISLGNAGGVQIKLNGRDLPPMGASGAVVKNVILRRESSQ
ncbi:MAG TPA: RodZ domain-containing protein [Nitrospiria bacterium]